MSVTEAPIGPTDAPTPAAAVRCEATTLPVDVAFKLPATWHVPEGPVRGVAVVAPGVAVPVRTMHALADALAAAGWKALSFDFPSIGASDLHPRDVPGGMEEWGARDLDTALREAAYEAGDDLPLVLVGHSAGAWLVGLTEMAERVDAVLAIASMSGYWRNLKRGARPQMLAGFYAVLPLANRLLGYVPGWLALKEDAPGGALAQWASWCRRPGFFFDDPAVEVHAHALAAPVRVLLPTDDEWATEAACRGVWDRFANADVEYLTIDPPDHDGNRIGHLGLLRDRFAETVWADAISWLEQVTTR